MEKLFKALTFICLTVLLLVGQAVTIFAQPKDFSQATEDLYEPKTNIVLPATVVWASDSQAFSKVADEVRPNTVMVKVNKDLSVYSMSGLRLAEHLTEYLLKTKDKCLTALYIDSAETAQAVKKFLADTDAADMFVVASSQQAELVKIATSFSNKVFGVIDFSDQNYSSKDLSKIIECAMSNEARVVMLPEYLANRSNLDYIRSRLTSVWVKTADNTRSIYTQLTNGVNGIVCEDFNQVYTAMESFNDGRALLRPSFITGHRGLPSTHVENTIRGAQAAVEAGADAIETDIYLSKDGQVFVLHDNSLKRLFNRPDVTDVTQLTLAELQAVDFDMTDEPKEEAPNSVLNSNNENRTKEGRDYLEISYDPELDKIPSMREYLKTFQDSDVVHFVELKTNDPAISAAIRDLAEELGMSDRIILISFNGGFYGTNDGYGYSDTINVLKSTREEWPEKPLGYLGSDGSVFARHDDMIAENGLIGAATLDLMGALEPYNATYNPYYGAMSYDVIKAGRHRGLTCWPWTYNNEEAFAEAYLNGIYGLTTNYTTWASNFPRRFDTSDLKLQNGEEISFKLLNLKGEEVKVKPELIVLEGNPVKMDEHGKLVASETGGSLVMLRANFELNVNDNLPEDFDNSYSLYSNPFLITVYEEEK
ncbi:MAG: glycerophosphodiester phosphodiesterase family protein [Eubacteriales bacterium]|nr:glycerophosphodiester phosphodiesterase family protein [Eubacteriales bacterium]